MINKGRILILSDIEAFIVSQLSDVKNICRRYNLNEEDIDLFFDWCINQILTDTFSMRVIYHYRHDVYLCVYSELKHQLTSSFTRNVNLNDFRLFKGCEVKTLINDKDLFITRRFVLEQKL